MKRQLDVVTDDHVPMVLRFLLSASDSAWREIAETVQRESRCGIHVADVRRDFVESHQ